LRTGGVDSRVLHSMARRYLMDRYDELSGMYAQLPNQGRAADAFHYSSRVRRIFPRYNVVEAMLVEVERLDPDRLPTFTPLRTLSCGWPTSRSHRSRSHRRAR
jgi:hypothetical protein